jgi:molybdenum cofactor biosynthesis protein MoaC
MPKGDVLALAEVAGVMAAKKTSDIIPLCHPLSLDQVELECTLIEEEHAVEIRCTARAFAKTGVEMEALQGVTAALLSVYDLTKGICPALTISAIRLLEKIGGKKGHWKHPDVVGGGEMGSDSQDSTVKKKGHVCATAMKQMKAAVLTISDRGSRGESEDLSGPIIQKFLDKHGAEIVAAEIVADEVGEINAFIERFTRTEPVDLILSTGGTGISPRDVTPEAILASCEKVIPGVGELIRLRGLDSTPLASLSRAFGGVAGSTVVIALPGSPKAVKEGLIAIHNVLPHMVSIAHGGGHDA